MTEANDVAMDTTTNEPVEEQKDSTAGVGGDISADVSMEPTEDNGTASDLNMTKSPEKGAASDLNTTKSPGKKLYTEEERLKRKEYFNKLREKRRAAREKHHQNFANKRYGRSSSESNHRSSELPSITADILCCNMSEEEKKMLEFYKVRLSTLKVENEQLHGKVALLVKENLRLLQKGPPTVAV